MTNKVGDFSLPFYIYIFEYMYMFVMAEGIECVISPLISLYILYIYVWINISVCTVLYYESIKEIQTCYSFSLICIDFIYIFRCIIY